MTIKAPINLNDYSKMVLNITSTADQAGTYSIGFGGPYVSDDYWTNNNLNTALGYGIAFNEGTHDYTFTSDKWNGWDASKKTQSVVYIQAQGDSSGESNTFTLNSITLYKNENASKEDPNATAAPIPTPSPTPVPTATPAVTERPAPPAAEAPAGEGWQQIDLTKDVTFSSTSYLSESNSLVMSEEDNVQVKLGTTYDKSQIIKVYLTGISYNDNQSFRVWSGARNDSRASKAEVVSAGSKGVAFAREITLSPQSDGNDDWNEISDFEYITICGPSYGKKISDLEITSIYYKPITIAQKPSLEPGEIDLSTCENNGNVGGYDAETGNAVIDNESGQNQYFFKLPENIANGETATITVKGIYNGTNGFRVWLGNGGNSYVTPGPQVLNDSDFVKGAEFEKTFDLTTSNECTKLTIKSIDNTPINGLTVTQIIVTKK